MEGNQKQGKGLADKEKIRIQGCTIKTEAERSVSEILRQIMGLDEVEEVEKKENLEKENKPYTAQLRKVYGASSLKAAEAGFERFKQAWSQYPGAVDVWIRN